MEECLELFILPKESQTTNVSETFARRYFNSYRFIELKNIKGSKKVNIFNNDYLFKMRNFVITKL
jgi:hypothetical protein